jgi:polar amino acid transport system substrate-binding protein
MMKARKLIAVLLAFSLVFAMVALTGCGGNEGTTTDQGGAEPPAEAQFDTLTAGKIIVGSDTAYPPFENVVDGVTVGFDVDIMKAIGERLGYEIEFKTYNFDALITGLQAGTEFDMVASAMTITEERATKIDFSDPYINSNQSLAVSSDSGITGLDDLKEGQAVGVQSGTTGAEWAKKNLEPKGIKITTYENILAAFGALSAGDVAGVINDLPISQDIVKDPARNADVVEEIPTDEQYGFAFNQADDDLREAVNAALADIKTDGTYVTIYERWFGAPPMSIP